MGRFFFFFFNHPFGVGISSASFVFFLNGIVNDLPTSIVFVILGMVFCKFLLPEFGRRSEIIAEKKSEEKLYDCSRKVKETILYSIALAVCLLLPGGKEMLEDVNNIYLFLAMFFVLMILVWNDNLRYGWLYRKHKKKDHTDNKPPT